MIFKGLRGFAGNEVFQVFRYLSGTLNQFAKDLEAGLKLLTFRDNFDCYSQEVSFEASAQVTLPNRYKTGSIDILFMNYTQPCRVVSVTAEAIVLENYAATEATAKVYIFKR